MSKTKAISIVVEWKGIHNEKRKTLKMTWLYYLRINKKGTKYQQHIYFKHEPPSKYERNEISYIICTLGSVCWSRDSQHLKK